MPTHSPTSEVFPSRFSTPVDELDDHRNQPESLPRADTMASHHRRGTAGTAVGDSQPPLLRVNGELHDGITGRDFEQAVYDDDRSQRGSFDGYAGRSPPVTPHIAARQGRTREGTQSRSRQSSVASEHSASPPNSVDAFAGNRRRSRAGTAGTLQSLDPAIAAQLGLRHSPSQSTFTRMRTLSQDHGTVKDEDRESDQGSVEDDVCFPQPEEPSQFHNIDFEDLHEFVLKSRRDAPISHPLYRKRSFSCRSQRARTALAALETKEKSHTGLSPRILPQIAEKFHRNSNVAVEDSGSELNEKGSDEHCGDDVKANPVQRWSFFSSELEESIHAPELGDLLMPGETFSRLFELGDDGGCWWLDMLMPSEEEVEVICKAFGIHGLTREDIIQQETREKVELFKQYYFVCFRSFYQMDKDSEDYLEPVNVYAVVFREGILTFTFCANPHAANVRKRMGRLRDYVSLGSDWICYALIDDIVDTFGPVIASVEHETDTIEDSVFTARSEDSRAVLRQIGACRKKVMSLLRLLGGKADVIKGFAKRCNEQYSIAPRQDVGLYLSDIQDHVVTMMSNLGHSDHMLSRSHANYLAQISVDNIAQGNRANEVLGKVTFIATILVPLNLVCGLFGMNVPVPGKDSENLAWFGGIIGCLLAFVLIAYIIARKKKLI